MEESGEKRKKRGAWSECHRLKKTCKYEEQNPSLQAKSCQRCLRLGKMCVPRVVVRKQRKRQDGEAEDASFEELDCLECIRLMFQSGRNSSFKGLSWFPKAFRSLGLEKVPTAVEWWVRHLFFTARKLQCFDRLYSTSALATTMGLTIDSDWISDSEQLYTKEETKEFEDYVNQRHWNPTVPMYFTKVNVGERELSLSPAFDLLFEDVESVVSRELDSKRNPALDLWLKFTVNKEVTRICVAEFTMQILKSVKYSEEPEPHYYYNMLCSPVLHVVGKNQEPFTCRIHSSTYFARRGKLAFFAVAFDRLEPSNAAAGEALTNCQNLIHATMQGHLPLIPPLTPDSPSSNQEELQSIFSSGSDDDVGLTQAQDEQLLQNLGWTLNEFGSQEVSFWEIPRPP